MKKQPRKYRLNKGFITQKMGDKTTIFEGEKSVLFTLNDTASYIFRGIQLQWDIPTIVTKVSDKYKISTSQAQKDIEEFVQVLLKKQIISSF